MKLHKMLQNPTRLLIAAHWMTGFFVLCIPLFLSGKFQTADTIIACIILLTSLILTICDRQLPSSLTAVWHFTVVIDFVCAFSLTILYRGLQYDFYYLFGWCIVETSFLFGWAYGLLVTLASVLTYSMILFYGVPHESLGRILIRLLFFTVASIPISYGSFITQIWKDANETKAKLIQEKERLVAELESITKQMTDYTFDVQNMAVLDRLTQLYNQTYFHNRLMVEVEKARQSGEPLSLALFDIDNFKRFNDSFGHASGDEVLRIVSKTIRESIQDSYRIAARIGGEEMVIAMPGTDIEEAFQFAQTVCEAISKLSYCFDERTSQCIRITVSGGVATFPTMANDATELTKCADIAMYAAKAAGKNRVIRYDQLTSRHRM
jgi:diguanylate cyclase (GGDEF)-like protein